MQRLLPKTKEEYYILTSMNAFMKYGTNFRTRLVMLTAKLWIALQSTHFSDPDIERNYCAEQETRALNCLAQFTHIFSYVFGLRGTTYVLLESDRMTWRLHVASVYFFLALLCLCCCLLIVPSCRRPGGLSQTSGLWLGVLSYALALVAVFSSGLPYIEDTYIQGLSFVVIVPMVMYQTIFLTPSRHAALAYVLILPLSYLLCYPHRSRYEEVECGLKLGAAALLMFIFRQHQERERRAVYWAKEEVRAKERTYLEFLQAVPEPILILSHKNERLFGNKALDAFSLSFAHEVVGRSLETLVNDRRESLLSVVHRVQQTESGARTYVAASEDLYQFQDAGKKRCLNIAVVPTTHRQKGDAVGIIIKDITDKSELEEREIAERYKRVLVCSLSHELKTPLNVLMGLVTLLESVKSDDQEVQTLIENARRGTEALRIKINDLLDWIDLQFELFVPHYENTNVRQLVHDLRELVLPEVRDKPRVTLKTRVARNFPGVVELDQERVRQILYNFLTNGIKYTVTGTVILTAVIDNDNIKFAVEDTGCGMAEGQLEHLFTIQPSRRDSVAHRKYSSLGGVGLCIHQQIARALQTQITVTSAAGVGTTFSLVFPVKVVQASVLVRNSYPSLDPTPKAAAHSLLEFSDDCMEDVGDDYSTISFFLYQALLPLLQQRYHPHYCRQTVYLD